MSILTDKINSAEYIYSANRKWGLKKYVCDVNYFTNEPLDDLCFVICSIINSNDEGYYHWRALGSLLGFSVSNQSSDGKHTVYYDAAEVKLFEDIISKVAQEHLVRRDADNIYITELGKISLKENKHFQFYSGKQNIYEHSSLKSKMPSVMLMFPFYNDMGIYTELEIHEQIWPNDCDIERIIYHQTDQLQKRIELHSKVPSNIYYASLQEYFDLDVVKIPVKLYKCEEEYIPVIFNGDAIAKRATELVNEDINAILKENIVLECLFQKLWDDKTAKLDYESLCPYFDFVDYEDLTKDSRTMWPDKRLFTVIAEKADSTCWRNISRHCDLNILYGVIESYKDVLDWPIMTERVDDEYLTTNFITYPWDLEVISNDAKRKIEVIEQLILKRKESEEEWDWEALADRLSSTFILSHLDVVRIDLSTYTKDTKEACNAILNHTDNGWNWTKIENDFNLQFINDNIDILGPHFGIIGLFDRIFVDDYWSHEFISNGSFRQLIVKASRTGEVLSSTNLNDKDYHWTIEMIDLLVANGLLCWNSSQYMMGFECNSYLSWTREIFSRYSKYVSSADGKKTVSANIKDVEMISDFPYFGWDWNAISENKSLIANPKLYTEFGDKLNWTIILANQTDSTFLQSIENIDDYIGTDDEAWEKYSRIVTIDYVKQKYTNDKYRWNWSVLTERMFGQLKLQNLGNPVFVERWNWTYLSEHVNYDFLNDNLKKFSQYWDWNVVLSRILTPDRRLDYNYLDNLALILTDIPKKDAFENAWKAMTLQYSFRDLKKLILDTVRKREYWWNIECFCKNEEFNVFRDLDECRYLVDWKILSSSASVDNCFKYNPKMGIKYKAWQEEVKRIITDRSYKWDYKLLSHFESLKNQKWFISQYKEKVDWAFLSLNSEIFCEHNKQKLNEIIEEYKDYVDFVSLSMRNDIDIEQIIKIYPKANYDYNKLIENDVIQATLSLIECKPDYRWNWQLITTKDNFMPTSDFLMTHIDCNINWNHISKQDNKKAWSDYELVYTVATYDNVKQQIDWYALTSLDYFPLTSEILESLPLEKLNWKALSKQKGIGVLIDEYKEYVDWSVIIENPSVFSLEIDFIDQYKEYLDWSKICRYKDFIFTNEILENFGDYLDWNVASDSKTIKFSEQLIDKYKDRWNWPVLMKNKAFYNTVELSETSYGKQYNIVEFISKFPGKPKAYHFTHLDNAIKIIRSMKLQCRNYANGSFSNSAGSNVNRTSKAHKFARFYFAPKSPTQFYNECLGKDKSSGKYYKKAFDNGLPKCPLPVFFVFDIEELLSVFPSLCYYSNGNMQKDSSKYYKVIEDPNKIKAKEIYIDNYSTFNERQQEFLVEGELDFSKLKNVQIFCYDDEQSDMLKQEIKGTKWENIVETKYTLYNHQNRELSFCEENDCMEITTDYDCDFEFRVNYSGDFAPTILNSEKILRQRNNNIYMTSSVKIKKDMPFEVYFEVNNPKNGSWLVYRNK